MAQSPLGTSGIRRCNRNSRGLPSVFRILHACRNSRLLLYSRLPCSIPPQLIVVICSSQSIMPSLQEHEQAEITKNLEMLSDLVPDVAVVRMQFAQR